MFFIFLKGRSSVYCLNFYTFSSYKAVLDLIFGSRLNYGYIDY